MRNKDRIVDFSWVAICCIATFVFKLWAQGARFNPGHGDTCYYYHVAENLYKGRGFVCDYVWSFLENPTANIPNAPSNAWWMPGPSILCAIGMWIAGAATFTAAKTAMIFFTSIFPAVIWWTAKIISNDRILAARAALLSVAFHPLIDQPSVPLSHGPYGMIVGAALVLLASGSLTIRRGAIFGALIALGHYFRGDAVTLFGSAAVFALFTIRREGLRNVIKPLGAAIIAYVLVMSPWFARNMMVFGAPMPPGPGKALYLRDYYDWFAAPERLTRSWWSVDGYRVLAHEKWNEIKDSLYSYWASYYDPTIKDQGGTVLDSIRSLMIWTGDRRIHYPPGLPAPWQSLRYLSIAMAWLTFGGIVMLIIGAWRRKAPMRWLGVYGLHSLAEITFYAVLFTGVASQSYVSSLYSLYPFFVVGIAAACDPIRTLGIRVSRPVALAAGGVATIVILIITAGNALGIGAYLRVSKGPEYFLKMQQYRELGAKMRESGFDPAKDRVMMTHTWNLYAASPLPIVRIPDEPLGKVLEMAQKSGVTWMIVGDPIDPLTLPPRRRYRAEVYEIVNKPEYFWKAFDFPKLGLHVLRIGDKAFKNPWGIVRYSPTMQPPRK